MTSKTNIPDNTQSQVEKPASTTVAYLKANKALVVSLLLNSIFLIGLITAGIVYRQTIATTLIGKVFSHMGSVSGYHLSSKLLPYDTQLELDYVADNTKYKQANIKWNYDDQVDNLDFVYNRDNVFIKFDSRQLLDYITSFFSSNASNSISDSDFNQLKEIILNNPVVAGESYLHLDKTILGTMAPTSDQEKDILESNRLVNEQIIKSLHFSSIPTIARLDNKYYLKIPLKIKYDKLNNILYPAINSYLLKNQETLKAIVDQTKVDVYFGKDGYIAKIIIISEPLTNEQAEQIFIDKDVTSFADLSKQMVKTFTENQLSISLDFSAYNQSVEISEPSNIMSTQDAMNELVTTLDSSPKPKTSKYTINNAYPHKTVSSDIFKDYSMVYNMLYRYYSEHGSYPSTLDSLANAYFPGAVPGNSQTGQGFSYSTFDSNQGYLLCPTSGSSREYCYKKFKTNEIN